MFDASDNAELGAFDAGALNAAALRLADWESSLIALGPVVCLHRREDAERLREDALPLLAWSRAQAISEVDSDGPREALRLYDLEGQAALQLCLLPDSDFLAWERLLQSLPVRAEAAAPLCRPSWLARLLWRARVGRFLHWNGRLRFEPWAAMSPCGERSAEAWSARCRCGPCQR
jgi:hypothetical protein